MKHSVGLGWQLDTASQSLYTGRSFVFPFSTNASVPRELHVWASLTVPGLGLSQQRETTKVPLRIVVWLSRQERQGTHSGIGTFQNVSSVRFLRVKGMWRQEKKKVLRAEAGAGDSASG